MTSNELYLIMMPIVKTVTGLTQVILADPNEEAPLGAYCAIRPKQSLDMRGQAYILGSDPGGPNATIDVRPQMVCEMVLEFYRGEAMDNAEMMKQANKRPDISSALYNASPRQLGWQRTTPVVNLSALQSNNWEQRAQISIYVMYELVLTENAVTVESIERVPYEVLDPDGIEIAEGEVVTPDAP